MFAPAATSRHRTWSPEVGTDSLRALQAGLASLFFLFATLATFGPWFSLPLGIALTGASIVAGFIGLYWSHRAAHSAWRHPWETGGVYRWVGWFASVVGIIASASYNGLVVLALHPVAIPVAILATLVFLAAHSGMTTVEDFFLAGLDPVRRIAVCARCGRRAPVDGGGWRRKGWMCAGCSRPRRGRTVSKIFRSLLVLSLVATAFLVTPTDRADAFCEILEPASDLPTEVRGTQIEIQLTEGFARVVIIKEFFNPSDRLKEGQVFFPLERGHELITDLRLKIGNVVYNSSGSGREEALDDFLKALASGKDAALVQHDPARDVYWIAVTIPPKESRTTITTLEMPLTKRDGSYAYDYRLSVDAGHSTEYLRLHLRVETSAPLDALRIPSHPGLVVHRAGPRSAHAWINSTEEAQGRDLRILFRSSGPSMGQVAVTSTANNATVTERYVRFSLDARDPAFEGSLRPLPRSFLILLDASGSMGANGRWTVAREGVLRLLRDLEPGETFALAAFQGKHVRPMADSIAIWAPSSEERVAAFLASVTPRGSTSLTRALPQVESWGREAADAGQQPILFLVTDGRPTVDTVALDIENAYKRLSYGGGIPVFALAVGPADHSDENLLRNVSHFNHGDFFTIRDDGGIDSAVSNVLAEIRVPVLHGVRATLRDATDPDFASSNPQEVLEGGEATLLARLAGAASDPLTVDVRWEGPSGGERAFARAYAGSEIPVQPLLRKEWVLTRIHRLLEEVAARADPATLDELKTFATANRVVTPYTSLVVTIPRDPPPGTGSGGSTSFDLGFDPFGGLLTGPGAPSSGSTTQSELGSRPVLTTALDGEAQKTQAFWGELQNSLVADLEVDRYVARDSEEHRGLELQGLVPRLAGRHITIYETNGELVGILGGWTSPDGANAVIAWSGAWGTLAFLALGALVQVHGVSARNRRAGSRRRT